MEQGQIGKDSALSPKRSLSASLEFPGRLQESREQSLELVE